MSDEPPTPEVAPSGGPTRVLPAHVTTPLLTQITQQSLDQDYQLVADRKAARARAAAAAPSTEGATDGIGTAGSVRNAVGQWAWVGVVAAFGILLSIAAVQTSRNAPVEELGRGALVKRITEQRADLRVAQRRLTRLRTNVADLTDKRSTQRERIGQTQTAGNDLAVGAGFAMASGSGVLVTVTDGEADTNQVRDEDLALVVNALWESGAEGVVVNGERVTALTAIRNSGTVIRVNRVGIKSPYRVEALGDPEQLSQGFANSPSGQVASAFAQQYGFDLELTQAQSVILPAAREPVLRSVTTTSTEEQGSERSAG